MYVFVILPNIRTRIKLSRISHIETKASPTSTVYCYVLMKRDYCRWLLNEFVRYVILDVSSVPS